MVMERMGPNSLPPKDIRILIEEFAGTFRDPVHKLRFLNQAFSDYHRLPSLYKLYPSLAEVAVRKKLLDEAEHICPGSRAVIKVLMQQGTISPPQPTLWKLYRYRHLCMTVVCAVLMMTIGTAVASLMKFIHAPDNMPEAVSVIAHQPLPLAVTAYPAEEQVPPLALQPSVAALASYSAQPTDVSPSPDLPHVSDAAQPVDSVSFPEFIQEPIWLAEKTADIEIYSNGLHIVTTYTVKNIPRRYCVFPRTADELSATAKISSKIAGIVYHASESDIIAFRPEENQSIKKHTKRLLEYIPRTKCYHYFIDRFGRVYRIVREEHAAFHAGNSVWADENQFYLNLNHAFLGICFEGKDFEEVESRQENPSGTSRKKKLVAMKTSTINDAQLQSGKELTEYLRFKYQISQHNCVPHGLTSVNPTKMLIGYHLDLSHGFPFGRLGLCDQYQEPIPSLIHFGFLYDRCFCEALQQELWPGISCSEAIVKESAAASQSSIYEYRRSLRKRFRQFSECERKAVNADGDAKALVADSTKN